MKGSNEMMNIEYVKVQDLDSAPWRSTYVLRPDMNLLIQSLQDYGWLQPILVREKNFEIIDGYHRCAIAQSDKRVHKRDKGVVPCVFVDCDEVDAMVMHVRVNRARGAIMAKGLSHVVRQILKSRKYDERTLADVLEMSEDEFDLLKDGSMIKAKKIAEHQYSKAWVPVEAPANLKEQASFIERPPNKDR